MLIMIMVLAMMMFIAQNIISQISNEIEIDDNSSISNVTHSLGTVFSIMPILIVTIGIVMMIVEMVHNLFGIREYEKTEKTDTPSLDDFDFDDWEEKEQLFTSYDDKREVWFHMFDRIGDVEDGTAIKDMVNEKENVPD